MQILPMLIYEHRPSTLQEENRKSEFVFKNLLLSV